MIPAAISTGSLAFLVICAMIIFYWMGYKPFDPSSWPVPKIDWFFNSLREYYAKLAQENVESLPIITALITWLSHFVLAFAAKNLRWVKSNTIRELVGGIFTGKWLKENSEDPTKE